MEKKQKIQSRRDFFKKALKGSLPIIGAVIVSKLPINVKAEQLTGCDYTCNVSCANDCIGHCRYGCKTTCTGTCSGSSR